jgi:poly(hydroxyalkanoate) depolymerase family esterase
MALNSSFENLMAKATQLSQGGGLQKLLAAVSPSALKSAMRPQLDSSFIPGNSFSVPVQGLMADAARLAQGGDLQAATAAFQAALRTGSTTGAAGDTGVIDVEAHEVKRGEAVRGEHMGPSASSTKPGSSGTFISGTYAEAADKREYKLYIPPDIEGKPLPLVMMLHGCTQNPDDFAAGTGMNEAALRRGFYVLYPAQTQHANSSRCWNWFKHNHQQRGRGEPALLAGMTREAIKHHNIDPQRVYVAGLSAGGAMAAILGDTYPDLFAAVGVHSGLATGSATNLQAALAAMKSGGAASLQTTVGPPTIVFHGDQDATVNPVNGKHVVAAHAGATEPEIKRARSRNGREYTQCIYKQVHGKVVAEHWVVHGAGHAWSGGSAKGSYTDPKGVDASEEMLRFFFANQLHQTRDHNPS